MGKPNQIGEIKVFPEMLKNFGHLNVWAHKAGTANLFEFVKRKYIEHFG